MKNCPSAGRLGSHTFTTDSIVLFGKERFLAPRISGIFIANEKGQPMASLHSVEAIAGEGLFGDRYLHGTGTYSGQRHDKRHVSFIHQRDIDECNADLPKPFTPEETRRNLLVEGDVDLLSLIGNEFSIGDVLFRGVEECHPCNIPEKMSGKPGFLEKFVNGRGGLRVEVLSSGLIAVGYEIRW